jgi:hypothetical protein
MSPLAGYSTQDEFLAELEKRGIKRTKRWLAIKRQQGEGPPWTRIGRAILYPNDGFAAYLKAHTQLPVRERRQRSAA